MLSKSIADLDNVFIYMPLKLRIMSGYFGIPYLYKGSKQSAALVSLVTTTQRVHLRAVSTVQLEYRQ